MNRFVACWLAAVAGVCLAMLSASRVGMAAGVLLAYAGFCGAVFDHHRRRRARVSSLASVTDRDDATLVAYASQTGFAEQLAMQTATALQGAGMPVHLLSFADLDARRLASFRQALFVVSTTGEGDAPDSAAGFARRLLASGGQGALRQLRYGVLALGDSSYARFCAFGHVLSDWLQRHHARPLFDLIEVDNGDAGALRHWQNHLSALSGGAEIADWERPRYGHWQLSARHHLNPGSQGAPAFVADWVNWGAGTRAAQALVIGAKARALWQGRSHATHDDIRSLAAPVLRHRILLNYRAEADGVSVEQVIEKLLAALPTHA